MPSTAAILEKIASDPEGGTEDFGHGATIYPSDGYFVGGKVSTLIVNGATDDDDIESIRVFLDYVKGQNLAPYVGWWTNEDDGLLYVDATNWYEDHGTADRVARQRHEIAFWDVAANRERRPVEGSPGVSRLV